MTVLEKLRPRPRDPRFEEARTAHAAGDFARARELAREVVAEGDASPELLRGLAEVEYLLGDYETAEPLRRRVVEGSGRNAALRVDADVALALVYPQTNRYAEAGGLFAGIDGIELPIWELMKSFRPGRRRGAGSRARRVGRVAAGDPRPPRDPRAAGDRGGR